MIRHVTFGYLIHDELLLIFEIRALWRSEIKNDGLEQYGAGPFEQQQSGDWNSWR